MASTKLKAPNGATVSVDSDRVENLLARGFTRPSSGSTATPAKKATAKKAASSNTSKS